MDIQTVIHAAKPKRVGGKMKKLVTLALLILLAGCAFNIEDWEPNSEDLYYAVQRCRSEMLLRDPSLGLLWHLSKDFKPCMEGTGHYKK